MHTQRPHTPPLPTPVPPEPAAPRTWLGALRHGPWMRRPWSRAFKIGGAIVGVFLVLLIAVNLIISADWVQSRVAARIKEQTGRDLTVNGSTMLLFTPGPHVVITDAKITDPDAQAGTADIHVAKLTLDLSFAELFSKQVDAERVVLVRPVLTVRVGGDAQPLRWGQEGEKPKKIRFAKAETGGMPERRREMRLKDFRIEDGTVVIVYDDKDASAEKRIEHINAKLSLPAADDPLIGKGKLNWKDERVDFSFEMATLADLRAKRPARLMLAVDTRAIAARFNGSLSAEPHLSGQGQLSAKVSSIPSLLAWMREKPTVANAIGDGELASDVSWTESEIKFGNARFALEHASGQGQAVISLKSPRPHIRAAFAFDHLNLNPFLAEKGKKKKKKAAATPKVRAGKPAPAAAPAAAPEENWFSRPDIAVVEKIAPPPPMVAAAPAAAPEQALTADPRAARVAPQASFDADVNLNIRTARVY